VQKRRTHWIVFMAAAAATVGLAAGGPEQAGKANAQPSATPNAAAVRPTYDSKGALQLPADYRRWTFVGSSLGLSYSEGSQPGMPMFNHVLMEPTAYQHFVETGTFREGTMFALLLQGTGENIMPARRGQFASDVHGVEMAVKDSSHRPEGWAYYNFGGMGGLRTNAQAMAKDSCYSCHVQHAKRDNVFLQFYPLLAEAAHLTASLEPAAAAPSVLALRGLDPVLLVEGREELGKTDIVEVYKSRRYQFVSEPHRARFAADPASYAIQNETCPVVPGAPIDPSLFAVHDRRIYGLATADCVEEFKSKPTVFVKPGAR
jgi:YHS domain-containing protein